MQYSNALYQTPPPHTYEPGFPRAQPSAAWSGARQQQPQHQPQQRTFCAQDDPRRQATNFGVAERSNIGLGGSLVWHKPTSDCMSKGCNMCPSYNRPPPCTPHNVPSMRHESGEHWRHGRGGDQQFSNAPACQYGYGGDVQRGPTVAPPRGHAHGGGEQYRQMHGGPHSYSDPQFGQDHGKYMAGGPCGRQQWQYQQSPASQIQQHRQQQQSQNQSYDGGQRGGEVKEAQSPQQRATEEDQRRQEETKRRNEMYRKQAEARATLCSQAAIKAMSSAFPEGSWGGGGYNNMPNIAPSPWYPTMPPPPPPPPTLPPPPPPPPPAQTEERQTQGQPSAISPPPHAQSPALSPQPGVLRQQPYAQHENFQNPMGNMHNTYQSNSPPQNTLHQFGTYQNRAGHNQTTDPNTHHGSESHQSHQSHPSTHSHHKYSDSQSSTQHYRTMVSNPQHRNTQLPTIQKSTDQASKFNGLSDEYPKRKLPVSPLLQAIQEANPSEHAQNFVNHNSQLNQQTQKESYKMMWNGPSNKARQRQNTSSLRQPSNDCGYKRTMQNSLQQESNMHPLHKMRSETDYLTRCNGLSIDKRRTRTSPPPQPMFNYGPTEQKFDHSSDARDLIGGPDVSNTNLSCINQYVHPPMPPSNQIYNGQRSEVHIPNYVSSLPDFKAYQEAYGAPFQNTMYPNKQDQTAGQRGTVSNNFLSGNEAILVPWYPNPRLPLPDPRQQSLHSAIPPSCSPFPPSPAAVVSGPETAQAYVREDVSSSFCTAEPAGHSTWIDNSATPHLTPAPAVARNAVGEVLQGGGYNAWASTWGGLGDAIDARNKISNCNL